MDKIFDSKMKKIHITENQLKELRKKITESYDVDITDDLERGKKSPSQVVSQKKAENPNLSSDANNGEVKFSFDPNGIDEEKVAKTVTKREIKEAKVKKLQENSVMFTKKDLC
ncbi:MAG: hypothetical protein J6Y37_06070 [Paludibacteraceae bacterium]|nr:hypothetical protein [Paludibacteraceae bacterium]